MKVLLALLLIAVPAGIFSALIKPSQEQNDGFTINIQLTKGKITKEKLNVKKKVTHINIMFSTITALDSDSFCAISNVESIDINGNYLFPKITKEHFECTKNLKALRITNLPNVSKIEVGAFATLTDLTFLKVTDVYIPSVTKDMFDGLSNLQDLLLINCKIASIDGNTFASVPKLKTLDLGHNEVSTFNPGTFSHIKHVVEIYLNKNNIAEINWEQWEPLPDLKTLDFGDNKIIKFDVKKAKEYFPSMKRLNLGEALSNTDMINLQSEAFQLRFPIIFQDYY